MNEQDFCKILEEMPIGRSSKITIAETDYALEQVRKTKGNKNATMQDIKEYNAESKGYKEGYSDAVEKYIEWRNKAYLHVKNLNPTTDD